MEKLYEDPELGTVRVVKSRRARRVSLRVHPVRGIVVTVPYWTPYAFGIGFFRQKRDWVAKVLARQAAAAQALAAERESFDAEALRKEAKAFLPGRSAKGNINLNLNLMRLEEPLRDYVLLHELCHLRHLDHGTQFHALLDRLCRDGIGRSAAELEKEVKSRRIL